MPDRQLLHGQRSARDGHARVGRHPARKDQWQGEVKRLTDLSADEIALWRTLCAARHELRSPFFSFEFFRALAEAGTRARVCLLYEDGALAGLFPFQHANVFAELAAVGERIGGWMNGFCGIVIDSSRHRQIGPDELLRCAGLGSLVVDNIVEEQQHLAHFGKESEGARVTLGDGIESYWKSVKTGHRSAYDNLRNRERKLEREFRSVEFVFAHEEPNELFDLLIAEKRAQYLSTGRPDRFGNLWSVRCLEQIFRHREGGCLPVFSTLSLDGEWAALHFGVRSGPVLHYWFPVYNRKFGHLSPGLILLARIIGEAAARGIYEIDLGVGREPYKRVFGTKLYPVYHDMWFRASLRGLAYHGYSSMVWRLRSAFPRWRILPGVP